MLFTILCCLSTGLTVFCIAKRVNSRAVEIAVRLAVRDVEQEFEGRNAAMKSQLSLKEDELKKARELVKLHEVVPSRARPATTATAGQGRPPAKVAPALSRKEQLKREGLEVFAMTRPFTDTSFGELLRTTDVVKIEATGR